MFTLWFMGRPAAGKSTIASRVERRLIEMGYSIENLDGDDIRKHLHPDLGFSREDRRINNRRTAYIAKLLNQNEIPVIVGMITSATLNNKLVTSSKTLVNSYLYMSNARWTLQSSVTPRIYINRRGMAKSINSPG